MNLIDIHLSNYINFLEFLAHHVRGPSLERTIVKKKQPCCSSITVSLARV